MKIAILTSSFPRYQGDFQGNFVYHQAQGQVERGNEVHVICPHIPGAPFHETMNGIMVHRFPYFYPYRFERLSSETGMYSALRHSLLAVLQLPVFILIEWSYSSIIIYRERIDLVHSHWIVPSGLVGAAVTFIWKKPHILTSHVLDANLFGKFRFFIPLLSVIVRSADMITTNSTYTKQQIEALVQPSCPIRVIPMGVNLPDSSFIPGESRRNTVLFVGRLVEWKGVDTLIRSMAGVRKVIPDVKLIIVGEGMFRHELESLVTNTGLTGTVQFSGRVGDEDLVMLYNTAAVFVLPSRSYNGLVMEGLGVVLLEAMAHGVPVIGSNVGGIPDIITDGENGFLVPEQRPDIIAEKIIRILTDNELQEKFRRNGVIRVQDSFSWEMISEKFSEVYCDTLERNRKKTS